MPVGQRDGFVLGFMCGTKNSTCPGPWRHLRTPRIVFPTLRPSPFVAWMLLIPPEGHHFSVWHRLMTYAAAPLAAYMVYPVPAAGVAALSHRYSPWAASRSGAKPPALSCEGGRGAGGAALGGTGLYAAIVEPLRLDGSTTISRCGACPKHNARASHRPTCRIHTMVPLFLWHTWKTWWLW